MLLLPYETVRTVQIIKQIIKTTCKTVLVSVRHIFKSRRALKCSVDINGLSCHKALDILLLAIETVKTVSISTAFVVIKCP